MTIRIHRSTSQTSAIIEITASQTKILIDGGVNLEENEVFKLSDLQAQYSLSHVNAVFLSHYKTDYITLAHGLPENVSVYAGKLTGKITAAAQQYRAKKPFHFNGYFEHGVPIRIGNITVTPFLVDDAAHDGYLLLIEGDGKTVIYTGDYRAHGRKSFEEMLAGLPKKVDALICEHGVIKEEDINLVTERVIEEQATKLIEDTARPVFVLQDVTDFDRASSMFRAAKSNKRVLLEDLYMSQLASAAGEVMPSPAQWLGVRAYLTTGYKADHFRYQMFTGLPRLGKAEMNAQSFVMCIRPSMKKFMKSLSLSVNVRNGVIINSLPADNWNSAATHEFLAFAVEKGLKAVTLRTSGHSDAMALKALVEASNPAKIIPVDARHARWLANAYSKIPVAARDDLKL